MLQAAPHGYVLFRCELTVPFTMQDHPSCATRRMGNAACGLDILELLQEGVGGGGGGGGLQEVDHVATPAD